MTEGEAKTKWCPFARVVPVDLRRDGPMMASGAPTYNRGSRPRPEPAVLLADSAMCVASACMAWRRPSGSAYQAAGFCGLAGHP